jgi:phytoene desaturase
MSDIAIIGSGFSGLSAAAILSQKGHKVTVYEKNNELGGRARQFKAKGYTFDMGPSWYWMPDVFDKFFNRFNKKSSDFYSLKQLDPGFQIIFDNKSALSVPANWSSILSLFEEKEKGSAKKLEKFMDEAAFKYDFGINKLVYEPGLSLKEVCKKDIFKNLFKLQIFTSYKKHVAKYFTNPFLKALLEFPVLFLGTSPEQTPALYSLMAYSGIKTGTFYPSGGFGNVIQGFVNLCKDQGVEFQNDVIVERINVKDNKARSISTSKGEFNFDYIVASADYHHVDGKLLEKEYQNYNEDYWQKKTFSPSSLLFYLGIDCKIEKLQHHNLFFDEDIETHTDEIYKNPSWPTKPLFYVCCPSKTDDTVAPKGKENLFLLMPLAPGLKDDARLREKYFEIMMNRLEKYCEQDIIKQIEYKKSYCLEDFKHDYNAYKGNAYGLANTLLQTANLKPKIINKKVSNLFYTGQLTVPGPGVPPSIISGQVVADFISKKII